MDRLDNYEKKPKDMENYLKNYGWHFSKSMCEWAVSMMKDRNEETLKMPEKKTIEEQIKSKAKGYDAIFVYCMGKADFLGSSLKDEAALIKFVDDYLSDVDGYEEIAFTRFYADCIAKGIPIVWSDML